MKLLLRTPSGSRLYGLSHPGSDEDWIEIYGWEKGRFGQKLYDDQDVVRASFDRFVLYCNKGVPQYLEALYSKKAVVDEIGWWRENYRVDIAKTTETYRRTMKKLWFKGVEQDDPKYRRHAFRLWLNLAEMQSTGSFDPTLDNQQARWVCLADDISNGHLIGVDDE